MGTRPDGTLSHNEDLVGKAFEGMRDEVVIATKFGVTHAPDKTLILDSAPDTIRASVEGSLKRLRTDYIDLYYQHRIDPKVEPEDVAEAMAELIGAGKIRAWGISEANEEYLRRAHAVCPVSAVQNRFSMMVRWHEGLFPVLEELGIPIPGSRKVERLRQNARASELSLTAGEMQAINAELAKSDLLVFGGHKAR